ncbi:hypothetical protein JCM10213_008427 [Rhodosporidiobolus nylandii]
MASTAGGYPYPARATMKYRPPPTPGAGPSSFAFAKGDRLTVLGQADDDGDWLEGETSDGAKGVFPAGFVERVEESATAEQEEKAPLQQAIELGVEKEGAVFTQPAAESDAAAESPSEVEAPPPPPPAAALPSPPALSSGAQSITDEPRPTASSPPSSSGPPPPAKKPSGLASRLAFFQQQADASAPQAPPIRPKPAGGGWKRPSAPPAAAPAAAAASSPTAASPAEAPAAPPPMVRANSSDSSGDAPGFSAADAQESIGRGGGSLKDRIKALQGLKVETPQAPGRAPKPWRKPVEESREEAKQEEPESQVKDEEPGIAETTAQSPGAEVPGFEPAEATPVPASPSPAAAVGEDETERDENAEVDIAAEQAPTAASLDQADDVSVQSKEEQSEATAEEHEKNTDDLPDVPAFSSGPETITDSPSPSSRAPDASSSLPTVAQSSTTVEPAEGDAAASPLPEDAAESEAAERSAIAARMAGLGGQRVGLPMPALPKRAAGPRRNRAAKPAQAEMPTPEVEKEEIAVGAGSERTRERAVTDEPVGQDGTAEAESEVVIPPASASKEEEQTKETEQPQPREEAEEVRSPPNESVEEERFNEQELKKEADVLASMGGASSLLARGDSDDDEGGKPGFDDDDDFDSPGPAAAARNARQEHAESGPAPRKDHEQEPEPHASPEPAHSQTPVSTEQIEQAPAFSSSPPPLPLGRPPVPPPFVREPSSAPEPAAEADQHADDQPEPEQAQPKEREPTLPPLPKGRPPIPALSNFAPPREEQTPFTEATNPLSPPSDAPGEEDEVVKPPIPVHPPRGDLSSVITPAEQAFILSQPEILSPAEEGADESTTGIEVDAPSVAHIAEAQHTHQEGPMPSSDRPHVRDAREEGVATPAHEEKEPKSPGGGATGDLRKDLAAKLAPIAAQQRASPAEASAPAADEGANEEGATRVEQDAEEEGDEEEQEEEEEDPEVARRRALAARMAKLGGVGMGPMFGGFGGLPPAPPKPKRTKSVKKEAEREEPRRDEAKDLESEAVETPTDSESPTPANDGHPPRRIGGMPQGGFALPGIAAPRPPPSAEPEPEAEAEEPPVQAEEEHEPPREDDREEEPAPPPLPPNRPPPSRAPPPPAPAQADEDLEQAYADYTASDEEQEYQHDGQVVDEPEDHYAPSSEPQHKQPVEEAEGDMPPPPPPPRPAGGHQSSLPQSPPPQQAELARSPAQGSSASFAPKRSSTLFSNAAEKLGFSPSPRQSLDLSLSGSPSLATPSSPVPGAQNDLLSLPIEDLLRHSASLGAQVFAAAYSLRSQGARGLSDGQFVEQCFAKATDARAPSGGEYGARVYEARVEGKKDVKTVERDEPRAGDVVAISGKLKHALTSKTVGSDASPHLGIVAGWDAKKGKLKVVEVDPKSGSVDEATYKVEDLKQGWVRVWRVVPEDA